MKNYLLLRLSLGVVLAIGCETNVEPSRTQDIETSQWIVYNQDSTDLTSNWIEWLLSDGGSGVWAGTFNETITHFNGQTFTTQTHNLFRGEAQRAMALDRAGNLWVGSYGEPQIGKFDGTSWTIIQIPNPNNTWFEIVSLAIDSSDIIWIGTQYGKLFSFDQIDWTEYTSLDSITGYSYPVLTTGPSGSVWITSGNLDFISERDGTKWAVHSRLEAAANSPAFTSDMVFDSQGVLWVGVRDYGIEKFDGQTWTGIPHPAASSRYGFRDIEVDSYDNIWAVGDSSILMFDGTDWIEYTSDNSELIPARIYDIEIDSIDQVWIGTLGQGLILFKNGN